MTQYKIEPPSTLRLNLRELWQYRELLFYFTWRDIKVKYKETLLGVVWVLFQPFVMMVLFSLIFSKGLKLESGPLPYPVFVLSGLVLWGFAASCMTDAAHSMELNAKIIKKIYFPRLIVPISAVATSAFDLLFGLGLLVSICIYFDTPVYLQNMLIAFPMSLAILTLAAAGFACMFSVLTAIFKDFRYIIPFFVQVLFFTSPIFYELKSLGDGWWTELLAWNPFAGGIHLFRAAFSGLPFPLDAVAKPSIAAILIFLTGVALFKKLEPKLADLI